MSTDSHPDPRNDAAIVVGLALALSRETRGGIVANAVFRHVDELAQAGDPTCTLVRDWLRRRSHRPSGSIMPSTSAEPVSVMANGEER